MKLWWFNNVAHRLLKIETDNNYKGYGILPSFKCLLLQFMENLSDREFERYLEDTNSAKWFCEFGVVYQSDGRSIF